VKIFHGLQQQLEKKKARKQHLYGKQKCALLY